MDSSAIEWTQFQIHCTTCGTLNTPTLLEAKHMKTKACVTCGAMIDLNSPEAKVRQSEAAATAMKRAINEASS